MSALLKQPIAHVVDVLGNVVGRDQPILRMDKALSMVSTLSDSIFSSDDVVFYDPFCKAGELLLSCAYMSCKSKIEANNNLVDVDLIYKEIFESSKYFALAPDERHHRLSLRTFLGNTNSHKSCHNHIIRNGNYLSEEDGTLNRDIFKKEFDDMIEYIKEKAGSKKIVAVGNPPYQESDGGFGKSAKSIYDHFTNALIESDDISEFVVVIPARWFGGGKGLNSFRDTLRTCQKVKNLRYFKKSNEVFPTVDINGGVCFLHYDSNHNGSTNLTDGVHNVNIPLNTYDIISDDPLGYNLIDKVTSTWTGGYISDVAWARKPFGLSTDYFNKQEIELSENDADAVACLSRNKKIKYANINDISKHEDTINQWKVTVPAVAGGSKGNRRSTIPLNQIFMLDPGVISTETYSVIDTFDNEVDAENLIKYLKTDFARYFLGLRKITQHLPRDRWQWVPYVDISQVWTDAKLFKYFKFSQEEIKHIQDKVLEWSC